MHNLHLFTQNLHLFTQNLHPFTHKLHLFMHNLHLYLSTLKPAAVRMKIHIKWNKNVYHQWRQTLSNTKGFTKKDTVGGLKKGKETTHTNTSILASPRAHLPPPPSQTLQILWNVSEMRTCFLVFPISQLNMLKCLNSNTSAAVFNLKVTSLNMTSSRCISLSVRTESMNMLMNVKHWKQG